MAMGLGSTLGSSTSAPGDTQAQDMFPKRSHALLDETGSDVEFVVGPEGDEWRFPAHRHVLAAASPVFRAMLTGPFAATDTVRITDVDGRAFHHLLKVLYGAEVEIRSERTCLQTLYCANKYLCPQLSFHCVEMLDTHMAPTSVLRVLRVVQPYVHVRPGEDFASQFLPVPSAPPETPEHGPGSPSLGSSGSSGAAPTPAPAPAPAPVAYPDPSVECNMGWYCAALLYNCLQFIDAHADEVFECECIEDLSHEELVMVVSRDSLALRRGGEMRMFKALDRWADQACKRAGTRISTDNKRAALGEAVYAVRYLLMSTEELLAGPVKSGLLESKEAAYLLGESLSLALGPPHPVPDSLLPHLEWFSTPRPQANPCYIQLSGRSAVPEFWTNEKATLTEVSTDPRELKREVKALKKLAKKKKREEQRRREEASSSSRSKCKCTKSCFAEVFFSVLACIFD